MRFIVRSFRAPRDVEGWPEALPTVPLVSLTLFMPSPPFALGDEDTRCQQLGEH